MTTPPPPRIPIDLVEDLAAWVAKQLGEPAPVRREGCRPVATRRRRRPAQRRA